MRPISSMLAALLLAACSTTPRPAPPVASASPSPGDVTFRLTVSNQSFKSPKAFITITIDGRRVIGESFEVGSQHTFKQFPFALAPGRHAIVASARDATLTQTFDLPTSKATRYGVFLYWNDGAEPSKFTWTFHTEPPAFD